MRSVQSVAEAHSLVTLRIREALHWTDTLLTAADAINTDLCGGRICSGNGHCSNGICICDVGFFGLDCGLPARRRTQTQCSSELEYVFCFDPSECDTMLLCVYDPAEERCVDADSFSNKGGFEYQAVCAVDSDSKCLSANIQNGVCDGACNIPMYRIRTKMAEGVTSGDVTSGDATSGDVTCVDIFWEIHNFWRRLFL